MLEILTMQLRQMLGGKRKWLVALCLVLPVLLTLAAVGAGGLGELQREIEAERAVEAWAEGKLPATAERVTWEGEDRSYAGGALSLTGDGLLFRGEPVQTQWVILINNGYLIVRDAELWRDASKADLSHGWRVQVIHRRPAGAAVDDTTTGFDTICAIYLFLLYPQAICLLLALFYGTSVLADELDGKTLTYLFTRPLPRWRFVVGKYLGIVIALILPTALSLLGAWLIMGLPGGLELFGSVLVGTAFALLAYNALFVLFGFLVPRRAMIVALLYGILFELILSFVPALVNDLTITYYLRSLVVAMLDIPIPREIARMVGGASAGVAVTTLLGITVGALGLASVLAGRREYVVKDTA